MESEMRHSDQERDQAAKNFINDPVARWYLPGAREFRNHFGIAHRLGLNEAEGEYTSLLVCRRLIKEQCITMEKSREEGETADYKEAGSAWFTKLYRRRTEKKMDYPLATVREATLITEKFISLGRDHLACHSGRERIQNIDLALHDLLTRGLYNATDMSQSSFIAMGISAREVDEWTKKWRRELGLKDKRLNERRVDARLKGSASASDIFIA